MDYGLFRSFEKIQSTTLPRTTQERGLFLLELRFSKEGATRSVPVQFRVFRSAFGEVARLTLAKAASEEILKFNPALTETLANAEPPVRVAVDNGEITFVFLEQPSSEEHVRSGALIFDPQNELATLVVRLHS
jgi:hypothetical protein